MWWVLASQLLFYFWDCIDNGLAEYWHKISIDTVLSQDWHRFGIGFRQDWHCIDAQVMRFGSQLALDWPQIGNGTGAELDLHQIVNWLAMEWQWIYTQVALTWQWIGTGLAASDWWPIVIGLATDKPRVSASAIVPNRCVHCTVLVSIFIHVGYMWDTCGIFICCDVGCMWDLKESEKWKHSDIGFPFRIVGWMWDFVFTFWSRNYDMSK